jgi:rod shape-determining protein MreD
MRRFLLYLILGLLFALIETSVLPLFFSPNWRPSLILLLVLYAGVREPSSLAVIIGLFLGAIQDSFCGQNVGLYVMIYLSILLLVRTLSEQLNVESFPLLLVLVGGGSLMQNLLLWFCLTLFADTSGVWQQLLSTFPVQLIANLVCAQLLLILLSGFRRLLGLRRSHSMFLSCGGRYGY